MSNYPPSGGYEGSGFSPPGPQKTQVLGLDSNVAGLLCYLHICCIGLIASILWLVTEPKENKFLRFHSIQSLLLFGVMIIVWLIFWILGVGAAFSPSGAAEAGASILLILVQIVVGLIFLVVIIIGMIKAYQGQMWKLPIIGDIADKNS